MNSFPSLSISLGVYVELYIRCNHVEAGQGALSSSLDIISLSPSAVSESRGLPIMGYTCPDTVSGHACTLQPGTNARVCFLQL